MPDKADGRCKIKMPLSFIGRQLLHRINLFLNTTTSLQHTVYTLLQQLGSVHETFYFVLLPL